MRILITDGTGYIGSHACTNRQASSICGLLQVGEGDGIFRKKILHAVERVTEHRLPHTIGERRAGDPPVLVADGTRAQEILHWTPLRSRVDTIIEDAWNWHVSGRDMVIRAD